MNRRIKRLNKRECTDQSKTDLPAKRSRTHIDRYGSNENNPTNYDDIFDESRQDVLVSTQTKEFNTIGIEVQNSSSSDNLINSISNAEYDLVPVNEILPVMTKMQALIRYLVKKTDSLSDEIRQIQNKPTLSIGNDEVRVEDLPLLKIFDIYKLPIMNQDQLEKLENNLKTNKTFYVFFVSFLLVILSRYA